MARDTKPDYAAGGSARSGRGPAIALTIGELFTRFVHQRTRTLDTLKTPQAFTVGLIQVLAVFSGISRSGVTMVAGMAIGLSRESAARFSMLLGTPVIAGAGLLVAMDAISDNDSADFGAAALGAIISAVTAYFVIAGLMKVLRNGSFRPFIAYCAVVGTAVVIARAAGV